VDRPAPILSLAGVGQRSSSLEHQNALLFVFSSGSPASSSSFDSSSPSSSSRCDALSRGWCSSTREQRGGEVTNISRKRKIEAPFQGLGFKRHTQKRTKDVFARTLIIDREMMISPRLANAQNWRRLAVTVVVAVGASAALFARIRVEGDRAHEKLLLTTQKRFPGFEDEEKKRTFLRRGASREERERRVREDLERKRDGSAKVLD